MNYADFIDKKTQLGSMSGFDPVFMPDFLFDFQYVGKPSEVNHSFEFSDAVPPSIAA